MNKFWFNLSGLEAYIRQVVWALFEPRFEALSSQIDALLGQLSRIASAESAAGTGGSVIIGPSIELQCDTDVDETQSVKLLDSGHVAVATGNLDGSGDRTIGLSAVTRPAGTLIKVALTGSFLLVPQSSFGKLYRGIDGFPTTSPVSGFTNSLGAASQLGIAVIINQLQEQIP